jgi:hypothetical protein
MVGVWWCWVKLREKHIKRKLCGGAVVLELGVRVCTKNEQEKAQSPQYVLRHILQCWHKLSNAKSGLVCGTPTISLTLLRPAELVKLVFSPNTYLLLCAMEKLGQREQKPKQKCVSGHILFTVQNHSHVILRAEICRVSPCRCQNGEGER